MRAWNALNLALLLLLQTPTPSPVGLGPEWFSGPARQEIFVAAYSANGQSRTVLVLHAREAEAEMPEADIQVWPSGRVKLKHPEAVDDNSRSFWYSLSLMGDQVKRDICRDGWHP